MAMGNTALLEQEVGDLHAANCQQVKKWETTKKVLQKNGILTGKKVEKQVDEAIQADQADQAIVETSDQLCKRAPSKCTNCGTVGHRHTHCRAT